MKNNNNNNVPCFYVSSLFRVRNRDKFLALMKEVVSDEPIGVREYKIHGEAEPYVEFSCPGRIYGLPRAEVGSITYKNNPGESENEVVFARGDDLITAATLACEEGRRITVTLTEYKEGVLFDATPLAKLNKKLVRIKYDHCEDSAADWVPKKETVYPFSYLLDALKFHVHPDDAIIFREARYGIGDAVCCAHVITYSARDSVTCHADAAGKEAAKTLLNDETYLAVSNWRDCDHVDLM